MILSRHDGIHQGQVEVRGEGNPGKPTCLGVGKPGREQKQKRKKSASRSDPNYKIHPGNVLVTKLASHWGGERLLRETGLLTTTSEEWQAFKRGPRRTRGLLGDEVGWVLRTGQVVGVLTGP